VIITRGDLEAPRGTYLDICLSRRSGDGEQLWECRTGTRGELDLESAAVGARYEVDCSVGVHEAPWAKSRDKLSQLFQFGIAWRAAAMGGVAQRKTGDRGISRCRGGCASLRVWDGMRGREPTGGTSYQLRKSQGKGFDFDDGQEQRRVVEMPKRVEQSILCPD